MKSTNITAVSKNVYIDRLDNIVDKYNNKYCRAIKVKSVDVKISAYIDFSVENNNDHVRISKYKDIFAKSYTTNWSEVFVIKKVKNTVPWTCAISELNGEQIVGNFFEGL